MLEMIYFLLEKRKSTARELAYHFDVSTKTIYRDVEALIKADIPIYMQKGVNGGISLDENYSINQTRLTATETEKLIKALADIKKLPNAKLEYALKMMKQYFNEAGTMWVNSDDVSLDIQDKFHQIKIAAIQKNIIEFNYFIGKEFIRYNAEPYELRIKNNIWKLIIRNIETEQLEEIYLSRMKDIERKNEHFTRKELPREFGKRYGGDVKKISFEIIDLTERILNTFPIENFEFIDDMIYLHLKIKSEENIENIINEFKEMRKI
jgi:predicted DNA-binding transcriptional regulator YafY